MREQLEGSKGACWGGGSDDWPGSQRKTEGTPRMGYFEEGLFAKVWARGTSNSSAIRSQGIKTSGRRDSDQNRQRIMQGSRLRGKRALSQGHVQLEAPWRGRSRHRHIYCKTGDISATGAPHLPRPLLRPEEEP